MMRVENSPLGAKGIDYFDLDRDGKSELIVQSPILDEEANDIGTTYRVYSWQGEEGYTFKEELQQSPCIFGSSVVIQPKKWNLSWLKEKKGHHEKDDDKDNPKDKKLCEGKDDDKSEGTVQVYIGNLGNGYTVEQVKLDSVRIEEKLAPVGKAKIKGDKKDKDENDEEDYEDSKNDKGGKKIEFKGKYLVVRFDKREAMETVKNSENRELKKGDKVTVSVSGLLNDGKLFIGGYDIEIEGEEGK